MKPLNLSKPRTASPFDTLYTQLDKSFSHNRNLQQLKEANVRKTLGHSCDHHGMKSQSWKEIKESSISSPGKGGNGFESEARPSRLSMMTQKMSIEELMNNQVQQLFLKNPKAKVEQHLEELGVLESIQQLEKQLRQIDDFATQKKLHGQRAILEQCEKLKIELQEQWEQQMRRDSEAYSNEQRLIDGIEIKKRCQGLLDEVEAIKKHKVVNVNLLNSDAEKKRKEKIQWLYANAGRGKTISRIRQQTKYKDAVVVVDEVPGGAGSSTVSLPGLKKPWSWRGGLQSQALLQKSVEVRQTENHKKEKKKRAASAHETGSQRSSGAGSSGALNDEAETGQLVTIMKQNLDRKHKRNALKMLLEQSQVKKGSDEAVAKADDGTVLPEHGAQGSLYARGVAKAQSSRSTGQNLQGFQAIVDNATKFSKKDSAKGFDRVKSRLTVQTGRSDMLQPLGPQSPSPSKTAPHIRTLQHSPTEDVHGLSSTRTIPLRSHASRTQPDRTGTQSTKAPKVTTIREALNDDASAHIKLREKEEIVQKFSRNQNAADSRRFTLAPRMAIINQKNKGPPKDSFEAAQEHAASLNNKFRYKPIQNVPVPLPSRMSEEQFAPKRGPGLQRQDGLRVKDPENVHAAHRQMHRGHQGASEVLEELQKKLQENMSHQNVFEVKPRHSETDSAGQVEYYMRDNLTSKDRVRRNTEDLRRADVLERLEGNKEVRATLEGAQFQDFRQLLKQSPQTEQDGSGLAGSSVTRRQNSMVTRFPNHSEQVSPLIAAISEESKSQVSSSSFFFTTEGEDEVRMRRKRPGMLGLHDPVAGLASASQTLQLKLMQQQLEDKLTYNAPLFTPEEAGRIFQVREVEIRLLDELRKLSRSQLCLDKHNFTRQIRSRQYQDLIRKHNLQDRLAQKRGDAKTQKVSQNQKNFTNFLLKNEGKVSGQSYGDVISTEPNHRKLILRNRVLGPMQLSKILDILTARERKQKSTAVAGLVQTPKGSNSKKSSGSQTPASNAQQKNATLPDLRQREITRLTHLDLSENDLGDAGLTALAKWIEMGSLMLKPGSEPTTRTAAPNTDIVFLDDDGGQAVANDDKKEPVKIEVEPGSASSATAQPREDVPEGATNTTHWIQITDVDEGTQLLNHDSRGGSTSRSASVGLEDEGASVFDMPLPVPTNRSASELIYLNVGQANASAHGLTRLLRSLRQTSTLIELDLANRSGHLRNSNVTAAQIQHGLGPLLTSDNCVLSILNLFGCNIAQSGLVRLAEILRLNKTVTSLNIGFNQLQGVTAAERICTIITYCRQIQQLDISRNKFGQRGLVPILDALCEYEQETRCHLQSLNLAQCGLSTFGSSLDLYHPVILDRIKHLPLQTLILDKNPQKSSLDEILQQSRVREENERRRRRKASGVGQDHVAARKQTGESTDSEDEDGEGSSSQEDFDGDAHGKLSVGARAKTQSKGRRKASRSGGRSKPGRAATTQKRRARAKNQHSRQSGSGANAPSLSSSRPGSQAGSENSPILDVEIKTRGGFPTKGGRQEALRPRPSVIATQPKPSATTHRLARPRVPLLKSQLERSMLTLRQLFLNRLHLQNIRLRGCQFGDAAFKVLFDGMDERPNSEELSLDLSDNLITNESIIYIIGYVLKVGTAEARLSAMAPSGEDEIVNPQRMRVLRLKALDLSNNSLKSIEPSLKELELQRHQWAQEQTVQPDDEEQPKKVYEFLTFEQRQKLLFERYLELDCPMKTLIGALYTQFFVQKLNLSGNEQLNYYFAQYVFQFLRRQSRTSLPALQFLDFGNLRESAAKLFNGKSLHASGQPFDASLTAPTPSALSLASLRSSSSPDSYQTQKAVLTRNLKIFSKNHLLLDLNLKRCVIGPSTLDQIERLTSKNRALTQQLELLLQLQRVSMLREYKRMNHGLEGRVDAARVELQHAQALNEEAEALRDRHERFKKALEDKLWKNSRDGRDMMADKDLVLAKMKKEVTFAGEANEASLLQKRAGVLALQDQNRALERQLQKLKVELEKKKMDLLRDTEVEQYRLEAAKEELRTSQYIYHQYQQSATGVGADASKLERSKVAKGSAVAKKRDTSAAPKKRATSNQGGTQAAKGQKQTATTTMLPTSNSQKSRTGRQQASRGGTRSPPRTNTERILGFEETAKSFPLLQENQGPKKLPSMRNTLKKGSSTILTQGSGTQKGKKKSSAKTNPRKVKSKFLESLAAKTGPTPHAQNGTGQEKQGSAGTPLMARAGRPATTIDHNNDTTAELLAAREGQTSLPGVPQSPGLQQNQSLPKLKEPTGTATAAGSQSIPGASLAAGSQAEKAQEQRTQALPYIKQADGGQERHGSIQAPLQPKARQNMDLASQLTHQSGSSHNAAAFRHQANSTAKSSTLNQISGNDKAVKEKNPSAQF